MSKMGDLGNPALYSNAKSRSESKLPPQKADQFKNAIVYAQQLCTCTRIYREGSFKLILYLKA